MEDDDINVDCLMIDLEYDDAIVGEVQPSTMAIEDLLKLRANNKAYQEIIDNLKDEINRALAKNREQQVMGLFKTFIRLVPNRVRRTFCTGICRRRSMTRVL